MTDLLQKERFVGRAIPLILSAFAFALAGILVVDLYIEHRQIAASTQVAASTISTLRTLSTSARSLQRLEDETAWLSKSSQDTVGTLTAIRSRLVATMAEVAKHLDGNDQTVWLDVREKIDELAALGPPDRVSAAEAQQRLQAIEERLSVLMDVVERGGLDALGHAEALHTAHGGLEATVLFFIAAASVSFLFGWRAEEARARARDAQVEEQLRRTLADLDSFAGRVAHDLRGPLMPILAGSQWIERAPVADAVRVHAERIARSARRLIRMIDSVLQYTRASAGGTFAFAGMSTSVNTAIQEVVSDFKDAVNERGGRIETEFGPDATLACPPEAVYSIVGNLLENALKYGVKEGKTPRITIRSRVDGSLCTIEVEDSGPGISPELRERVFETFFRGKKGGVGIGLGLSIVQRLVETLHGQVELKDGKEGGALFSILLPLDGASRARSETPKNDESHL